MSSVRPVARRWERPIRLGVLVSGGGTTLQNFLDRIRDGSLHAEVAVVIANRSHCGGLDRAEKAGVPRHMVLRRDCGTIEEFSRRVFDVCRAAEVDLVTLAGFLALLRIPDDFQGRVMNIHPALIPGFCGDGYYGHRVHEAVLARGVKVSGCSVHFADNEYDHGPIIVQKTVPVLDGDTPDTLAARVFQQECEAYPEAIRLFAAGRLVINGSRVEVLPAQSDAQEQGTGTERPVRSQSPVQETVGDDSACQDVTKGDKHRTSCSEPVPFSKTCFPHMIRVFQKFEAPRIDDVPGEVERQLASLDLGQKVRPGQTVAITAGSRGIRNIAQIIKAAVDHFKRLGAVPFVVPAMGSHGGGTAEGQRAIIEGYGITEEYIGAEIRASMETVTVAQTPQGFPVHFDKHAYEADHVLVCGRIKPHTGFTGEVESGLHKMMLIGLGKHAGAEIYHKAILDYSFAEIIHAVAGVVLEKCKIVAGLAIVENAYDETGLIEAVRPEEFFARERELLTLARRWMPRLPFKHVDLLIVDEIGKNISGTGLDTNVIGRKYGVVQPSEKDEVKCKRIFIRGLTEATHGNACGLGYADVTNQRTFDRVDRRKTAINALTANRAFNAALPIALDTDRECVATMLDTIGLIEPQNVRVVQIANTIHLKEVLVSEAYLPELEARDDLVILAGPHDMQFDADGNLLPVISNER